MAYLSDAPRLIVEQLPQSETEGHQLDQLAFLLDTTDSPPDLRDLAPAVRELFPSPAYEVGCGSSHIWLHRTADQQRLALIR